MHGREARDVNEALDATSWLIPTMRRQSLVDVEPASGFIYLVPVEGAVWFWSRGLTGRWSRTPDTTANAYTQRALYTDCMADHAKVQYSMKHIVSVTLALLNHCLGNSIQNQPGGCCLGISTDPQHPTTGSEAAHDRRARPLGGSRTRCQASS